MSDDPTQTPPASTPAPERTVPYSRFQELVSEKNALKAQLEAVGAEAKGHQERAATADTLAQQIKALKAEHEAQRQGWEQERTLFAAGITDPEGHAVARTLYQTLPEDKRPPSIKEWIGSLSAEGAAVPRGLAPYLPQAAKPAAESAPVEAPKHNGTQPQTPRLSALAPSAPSGVTAEAIRAATLKGRQTGDWSDFKTLTGRGA
jgi:hypothetical protein